MRKPIFRVIAIAVALAMVVLPDASARADKIRDGGWYLGYLHVAEAQRFSEGEGVIVAVIDTGVNADQPELSGKVLSGTDEYRGFTGNGQQDNDGHGTGMASLIAGHGTGHNKGTLGIAPMAKILPIRDTGGGIAFPADVRSSITWAVQHGASVLCIATQGTGGPAWQPVIDAALAANVVIVAGVGNSFQGARSVAYPAAYPGVVAAGGIDHDGTHAEYSVTGPEVVISAPATKIITPEAHGQYAITDGTSNATAIVAGAAALVRARYPQLSAAEVVHRLEATATDAGPPGRDDLYGYGIVNLIGALTADVPPLDASATTAPVAVAPSTVAITPASSPTSNRTPLIAALTVLVLTAIVVTTLALYRRRH